jgi:pantoate--beta-alanine ligase
MQIIHKVNDLREYLNNFIKSEKTIGFVPTMGFLHEGHISLIQKSKEENSITVVSIFVNPTQFNNLSDFEKYPKNEEADIKLLEKYSVDILFLPSTEEIYGSIQDIQIEIKIPKLMKNLCAPSRPGHFEGVLQVVSKLFHYVSPKRAYFGLKDYQQFLLIRELVKNLSFPIEIIGLETIREKSGLALSSRNSRLSVEEKDEASLIYRSMIMAYDYSKKKNVSISLLKELVQEILLSSKSIKIDYLQILDPDTLEDKIEMRGKFFIGIAVYINEVRLIDNIRFEV